MNGIIKHILSISLVTLFLSGCSGEPEWVAVYDECKATVIAETAKLNDSQKESSAGEDPQMKAMRESMNTMALTMAMTACEMIKANCENDPDSATCQAYIKQSKNRNQ